MKKIKSNKSQSVTDYLLFKYLRFDKEQPFIMLSMVLAFIGVCVGLCVLLVAMAIMNGFDKGLRERFAVMNYPLSVFSAQKIALDEAFVENLRATFPQLIISPYISTQVIARGGSKFEGGILFGVHSKDEKQINKVVREALKDKDLQGFDILVGRGLVDEFSLQKGDKLPIIFSNLSPSGLALTPQTKRFDVRHSFSSGLALYDRAYMYADIDSVRLVLGRGATYNGVHIAAKGISAGDIHALQGLQAQMQQKLGENYRVVGWWEQNANLFSALELEKRALFIVLLLIILAASLNIVSSLLMIVMNRRAEIALLLALGASKSEVKKAFFALGTLVGGFGMLCGVALSFFVLWLLENFDIITLPADVYGTSKLLLDLDGLDFILAIVGAAFIVMISSYYPARKATQVNVLDTLRNE